MYKQINYKNPSLPEFSPYPIYPTPGVLCPQWQEPVFDPVQYKDYYLYIHGVEDFIYDHYYKSNGTFWEEVSEKYTYLEDREKLDAWLDFVYNNNLKLLKDCQGNKWIVSISDNTSRSIDNASGQYPTKISFTWQEVMDAKTTPIINLW